MLNLREYQSSALLKLRGGFLAGHRSQLLYGPCGSGKTETAISLMVATSEKSNHVAMVMDRRILVEQTSHRLSKYNICHGVLMSEHWNYSPDKKIQICSAQTLEVRGSFPGLKLLIVDEAHCNRSSIIEFIKNNQSVKVIGLSASPFTKGLGSIYSNVVNATTTKELVNSGSLTPLRVFISKEIDMTGAKKVAGEWSQKEATERGIKITGDIVSEWVKKTHEIFGMPKKTIVFCAGVAHGEDLSRQFAEAGYNFVSLSYRDDDEFKRQAIEDFSRPDSSIHGLIATDILTKGFDQADVFIGISARPFTKSFSSHVQQLGRVMRSHDEKSEAIWLDFSGNYLRFQDKWENLYSEGVDELDDDAEKPVKEPTQKEKEAAKCPRCGAVWAAYADVCPHCGNVRVRRNDVITLPGEIIELHGKKAEKFSGEYKEAFFRGLLGYAKAKGFKDGWAFHKYIEKFGCQPVWKKIADNPNQEVIGWIQHKNIAWAKRRSA